MTIERNRKNAGFDSHLVKPVDYVTLLDLLRHPKN
jgi:hypothetical protein